MTEFAPPGPAMHLSSTMPESIPVLYLEHACTERRKADYVAMRDSDEPVLHWIHMQSPAAVDYYAEYADSREEHEFYNDLYRAHATAKIEDIESRQDEIVDSLLTIMGLDEPVVELSTTDSAETSV